MYTQINIHTQNIINEKLYSVSARSTREAIARNINDRYDMNSLQLSAFSGGIIQQSNDNITLPPSSVFTGTRLTRPKSILHAAKNAISSHGTNEYAAIDSTEHTIFAPGPAKATRDSCLYGRVDTSERITAPNGNTVTETDFIEW